MKLTLIIILMFVFSCKQQKEIRDTVSKDSLKKENLSFTIPNISEETLRNLFSLQMKIIKNPSNIEFRKEFISKAHYTSDNALIALGCAKKVNPTTGQNIPFAMVKRAAQIDAKRWAAYGTSWIRNEYLPDFGKLNTTFNGLNQQINSFNHGDSLVIALAVNIIR